VAVSPPEQKMIKPDMLREALAADEFFLEYLPTIDLADGRCAGAEALIRWNRSGGVIPPLDFIPIADDTPVSGLITYWVMDTVAAELGEWLASHPQAHLSINVPPEVLGRGGLEYAASRSKLGECAQQLILEITERGLPDHIGIEGINHSRELGVRIALDDVTLSGPANVAVLARANIDVIKLDASLVGQIVAGGPPPDWLDDVAAIVRSSRLAVIAEGVEQPHQLAALRAAGVQHAQGFHFSRPLSAEQFVAFHAETAVHPLALD
jgi:sensor c-di-GMP phosphodiesterase-like protein